VSPHLARARDAKTVEEAVAALLDAWRASPAPAIAAKIDELAPACPASETIDRVRTVRATAAIGLIAPLEELGGDPRVAAAIIRLLQDPPFHATGAQPFWTILFRIAAKHLDQRSRGPLALLPERYRALIRGGSMRDWMKKKLTALITSIPADPPALDDVDAKILASIRPTAHATAAPAPAPASKLAELLAAVYADPADDAARAVYADALQQKGDPRGEFIALQLAGDPDSLARADRIRKRHQPAWLGELGAAVHKTFIGWRRGFLANVTPTMTLPKLAQLGPSRMWSTVEEMDLLTFPAKPTWRIPFAVWMERMTALRRVPEVLLEVLGWIPAAVRERLEEVGPVIDQSELGAALAIVEKLPRLRALGLSTNGPEAFTPADVAAIVRSPLYGRLETLKVTTTMNLMFELARAERQLTIHMFDPIRLALLERLPGDEITSVVAGMFIAPSQLRPLRAIFPGARIGS
jgi:uncharacterized protein (TIGR02996 family)